MEDTVRQELATMLEGGLSVKAIAEELGISEGTVRNEMNLLGVKAHGQAEPAFTEELLSKYQNGVSAAELLREYGISYTKLYGILARRNIPTRRAGNLQARQRQMDEAISLYEQGVPVHAIVAETGIAQPTLHAELHARHIPLRRPRKEQS